MSLSKKRYLRSAYFESLKRKILNLGTITLEGHRKIFFAWHPKSCVGSGQTIYFVHLHFLESTRKTEDQTTSLLGTITMSNAPVEIDMTELDTLVQQMHPGAKVLDAKIETEVLPDGTTHKKRVITLDNGAIIKEDYYKDKPLPEKES